jgi:hypothetical protein
MAMIVACDRKCMVINVKVKTEGGGGGLRMKKKARE